MSKPEILAVANVHPLYLKALKEVFQVHERAHEGDPAVFAELAPRIVGIAASGESMVSRSLLEQLPNLKLVSVFGVGYDGIDVPAAIRQGFTAAFAGPGVSAAQKALADALLAAIGEVAWVDQEDQINPVTAVSGGGPAYVFLLAEVLEAAAVEQGLPRDLARRMARATVAGSGALLGASEQDAADLRRAVTSPKGTTERALAVLMEADAWPKAMSRAIQAATDRARELAG